MDDELAAEVARRRRLFKEEQDAAQLPRSVEQQQQQDELDAVRRALRRGQREQVAEMRALSLAQQQQRQDEQDAAELARGLEQQRQDEQDERDAAKTERRLEVGLKAVGVGFWLLKKALDTDGSRANRRAQKASNQRNQQWDQLRGQWASEADERQLRRKRRP